jgi:ureidoglycolate lyase
MTLRKLKIEPLTQEAFIPFGDVIETDQRPFRMINNGSTRRYHNLAQVETAYPADGDRAIISIFRVQVTKMPFTIRMLERHPLGSQAFVPLLGRPSLVVVAPPTDHSINNDKPQLDLIRAFITNGKQGVNYHRRTWHHPVLAIGNEDYDFLVVDREGSGNNCDEHFFQEHEQMILDYQP